MAKKKGRPIGSRTPARWLDVIVKQPVCPHCGSALRTRLRTSYQRPLSSVTSRLHTKLAVSLARCRKCGSGLRFLRYLA